MPGIGFPGKAGGRKSYSKVYSTTILRGEHKGRTLLISGVNEAGGVKKFAGYLGEDGPLIGTSKQINTLRHQLKFGKLAELVQPVAPAAPTAPSAPEGNAVPA
mgnify:CR=1 FL=1